MHRNSQGISVIPELSENSSSQSTPLEGNPFFSDQSDQHNRSSKLLKDMPVCSLQDQPTSIPLPPLAVEKVGGWSCGRCTLINYNAQLWCEACGGKRPNVSESQAGAYNDHDLDVESEDAPPRVGHVLDKMVLFTSMEAKAQETPSLKRRSGEFNKITRNYSFSSQPMGAIDENPLEKTLERITQTQAQLIKPQELFTSSISKDPANTLHTKSQEYSSLASGETPSNKTHENIIKEQEKMLERARINMIKAAVSRRTSAHAPMDNVTTPYNPIRLLKGAPPGQVSSENFLFCCLKNFLYTSNSNR